MRSATCAAAWIDATGQLIAQGRYGLPIFMADLATSVVPGIERYGLDGFAPGDVVITNHAESCGQHLNNVVVYSPIFAGDELVVFTATRAHWADVGGKAVGSWATDSTEIFQEGVQWDTLKVFKGGVQDDEVIRMIEANVRFPDQVLGDMRAQITACRLGERRFAEMVDKYGMELLSACVHRIWDQSEQRARAVVEHIPDGTYRASAFLDNDGVVFDETLNVEVAVIIDGSEMTVDLTGTHEQARGPMNCGIAGALAAARVAFKCITSPGSTPDEGAFRPLHLEVQWARSSARSLRRLWRSGARHCRQSSKPSSPPWLRLSPTRSRLPTWATWRPTSSTSRPPPTNPALSTPTRSRGAGEPGPTATDPCRSRATPTATPTRSASSSKSSSARSASFGTSSGSTQRVQDDSEAARASIGSSSSSKM